MKVDTHRFSSELQSLLEQAQHRTKMVEGLTAALLNEARAMEALRGALGSTEHARRHLLEAIDGGRLEPHPSQPMSRALTSAARTQ